MSRRSLALTSLMASSPGPGGFRSDSHLPFTYPKDPLLAKRSMSSINQLPSRLANISNPSLESQLAHDFQARANVASSSQTSLGQHGRSTASLSQYGLGSNYEPVSPPPLPTHNPLFANAVGGQGSAPTSPYGHPKGVAVSHGVGMGRHQAYRGGSGHGMNTVEEHGINPMFQVVSLPWCPS